MPLLEALLSIKEDSEYGPKCVYNRLERERKREQARQKVTAVIGYLPSPRMCSLFLPTLTSKVPTLCQSKV